MACSSECVCLNPPLVISSVNGRWLWEHVEKDKPLCIVVSPTNSRLLDLVVETANPLRCRKGDTLCVSLRQTAD